MNGTVAIGVKYCAKEFGWEEMSTKNLGLMLFALFHYYVMRLGERGES